MQLIVKNIEPFEISKGFNARLIHTETMTVAFVEVEEGAELPEHSHFHEQVTNLLEGEFEFVLNGAPMRMKAGESVVIPANAPHSGKAITKCHILDVFNPVREDFKNKNVAYANR